MTNEELAQLPPHLWNARGYAARHPASVQELLELAETGKTKWNWREALRRIWCSLRGHDLTTDRWVNADNPRWFEEQDYEIHLACKRCPFVQVLNPKDTPEGKQG